MSVSTLGTAYPDFFHNADATSLKGQARFARATRVQLFAIMVAAVAGAFTLRIENDGPDWAGVLAAITFVTAALLRAYLWQSRPDRDWYAGRAAAESAKTLAWRFAAGADPFPMGVPSEETDELFLSRLADIRRRLHGVIILDVGGRNGEITSEMTALRSSSLEVRKKAYLQERIEDQRTWYSKKAEFNRRRARAWAMAMLILEIVGAGGAVLKATGSVDVDVLGLASALIAGAAAWSEMRQHNNLASAYSVAAGELSEALELGKRVSDEAGWSSFVSNAEEAVSREHTMWVASRGR